MRRPSFVLTVNRATLFRPSKSNKAKIASTNVVNFKIAKGSDVGRKA